MGVSRATSQAAVPSDGLIVETVRPTVIYTHSLHDVHQDHRNTHRAALVAVRQVGRVYCFQSPSATVAPAEFEEEIRAAVRYEKGLAVKAVIALAIVAIVVLIRLLFLG